MEDLEIYLVARLLCWWLLLPHPWHIHCLQFLPPYHCYSFQGCHLLECIACRVGVYCIIWLSFHTVQCFMHNDIFMVPARAWLAPGKISLGKKGFLIEHLWWSAQI